MEPRVEAKAWAQASSPETVQMGNARAWAEAASRLEAARTAKEEADETLAIREREEREAWNALEMAAGRAPVPAPPMVSGGSNGLRLR